MRVSTVLSSLALSAAASASVIRRVDNTTEPEEPTDNPCAAIASLVTDLAMVFPPSLAWDCLNSIPLDVNKSLALVDYVIPYLELNSIVDDLKSPGPEYLVPGMDLIGGYEEIKTKLEAGEYNSQFEFVVEMETVAGRAQDGHVALIFPHTRLFNFKTAIQLVSVSEDGISPPKPFLFSDIVKTRLDNHDFEPSPIHYVDGIEAGEYLEQLSIHHGSHDPDSQYNSVFETRAKRATGDGAMFDNRGGYLSLPDNITLSFANNTESTSRNVAILSQIGSAIDWANITSGADLFDVLEHLRDTPEEVTSPGQEEEEEKEEEEKEEEEEEELLPITPWNNYPWPYDMHLTSRFMTAYFLNDTEYDDIGVLAINGFGDAVEDLAEYIRAMESYMEEFVRQGRKKLIIDMTSNQGGLVFLSMYTYQLLFGGHKPYDSIRLRATETLDFIGQNTFNMSEEEKPSVISSWIGDDGEPYESWDDMFGPVQLGYSNSLQTNPISHEYANALEENLPLEGFQQYTDIVPKGYFKPEDIIVMTDGICASACPHLVNHLTYEQGVRSIAVGGRPLAAPMQSRGGTRGGAVFEYTVWGEAIDSAAAQPGVVIPEDITLPDTSPAPMLIGLFNINGQNLYRPGEDEPKTSLQFSYEAANCKTYYTPDTATQPVKMWEHIADIAWNEAKCVPGSTVNDDDTIGATAPAFSDSVYSTATWPVVPGGFKTVADNVKITTDVKMNITRVMPRDTLVVVEDEDEVSDRVVKRDDNVPRVKGFPKKFSLIGGLI